MPEKVTKGQEPAAHRTAARGPRTPVWYVVKKGDMLWSIAARYYGSGTCWKKIVNANPGLAQTPPQGFDPGDRILIPPIDAGSR